MMKYRVGISLIQNELNGRAGWVAGFYYIKNCLNAFAQLPSAEIPHVIAFIPDDFNEHLLLPEFAKNASWLKIVKVPCDQNGHSTQIQKFIDENPCDVYFPFITIPPFRFKQPMIGWIPDFQYKHFPEFFTSEDIENRDLTAKFMLENSHKVICISQTVALDIENYYPAYKDKAAVLPFKSLISASQLSNNDTQKVLEKYQINKKYIFMPNQFWIHKNHKTVFTAWNELKKAGCDFLLVCTGKTTDYRDPDHFNNLMGYIKNNQLEENIRILGFIDRYEQIQLFRYASAVLQPSLFEGWNTSVEDAKSLGKRLIVSDIPVHHEQCGTQAMYFDKTNPEALAKLIRDQWETFPEGYDAQSEKTHFVEYQNGIQKFARDLLNTFATAITTTNENDFRKLILQINSELQVARANLTARAEVITKLEQAAETRLGIIEEQKQALQRLELYEFFNKIPLFKIFFRLLKRLKIFLTPKIGMLNQYLPRKLVIPEYYNKHQELKKLPIISIVTPSFNQSSFIEQTIKSVLDQNYPQLEYIIQDGGSNDGTIDILHIYSTRLKHWDSKKDQGQSHALNLGFRHATGEIMSYLNSDDLLLPGALQFIADYFEKHPEVDVVYGHRIIINEIGEEIGRWILPPHDSKVLSWSDYIPQETLFWRRRIWEKVESKIDESFQFAMDWDLILRFREANAKFARLPRFLGAFRVHTKQKTSAQMIEIGQKEMQRLRQRCHNREVSHEEINAAIKSYLRRHIVYHKLYKAGLLNY